VHSVCIFKEQSTAYCKVTLLLSVVQCVFSAAACLLLPLARREALGAHVKMGQQLASLLSIKTQPPIQVPGSRPLTMRTSFGNPLFSPTDGGLQEAAAEAAAREEGGAESRRSWDRRDGQVQGERKPGEPKVTMFGGVFFR
jgi:hypothetical protein